MLDFEIMPLSGKIGLSTTDMVKEITKFRQHYAKSETEAGDEFNETTIVDFVHNLSLGESGTPSKKTVSEVLFNKKRKEQDVGDKRKEQDVGEKSLAAERSLERPHQLNQELDAFEENFWEKNLPIMSKISMSFDEKTQEQDVKTQEQEKTEKKKIWNNYDAMNYLSSSSSEAIEDQLDQLDQLIPKTHTILFDNFSEKDLKLNCLYPPSYKEPCNLVGKIRQRPASAEASEYRLAYTYPAPEKIDGMLHALIDHHNSCMKHLLRSNKESEEYTANIFKCAARLMFEFVSIHPYGGGNGRLSRLLANYVLRLINPFPVTIYHNDWRSSRNDYLNAIIHCRDQTEGKPQALAAMLVEEAWYGWKALNASMNSAMGVPKRSMVVKTVMVVKKSFPWNKGRRKSTFPINLATYGQD